MVKTVSLVFEKKFGRWFSKERQVPAVKRASLWLMCLAVVLIVALKPERIGWDYFHLFGWPALAFSLFLGWRTKETLWLKTLAIFAYVIVVLFFTRLNSNFTTPHMIELFVKLGIGLALVPALLAKYWLKTPLTYRWLNGKWSWKMWVWLPTGFLILAGVLWFYFNVLTPDLYTSWPLVGGKSEALTRIFWTCNLGGCWDELVWINLVFSLMSRHFSTWEANLAQAVFFTSFLYAIAFFGTGAVFIYVFALVQGYTYKKTGSLLYLIILHFFVDLILFFMVANKYFPGHGLF